MHDLTTIPPHDLHDAWMSLASNGTPPAPEVAARALPAWSVGLNGWLDRLTEEFLRDYCRRNAHFKLAIAPYGGGKTHFLLAVASRAAEEGWAVSYLQCKDHVSLSDWFGLCKSIIASIRLPSSETRGVRPLARAALAQFREKAARAPDQEAALDEHIAALEEADWPHSAFARVMSALLRHMREPSAQPGLGDAARRWLECDPESLTPAEREALRLAPLRTGDRAEHGRTLFASMVKFIPLTGAHGLALLLDEMDVVFNARGKALERILNAMRILLDAPDGRMDSTPLFGLFAAPPDIAAKIKGYPALDSRFRVVDPFHNGSNSAPQIDLSKTGKQEDVLHGMSLNLLRLGVAAHEWKFDETLQRRNGEKLASVTAKRHLEVDARRLFVKTWCALLEKQARDGERDFSDDQLNDLLMGSYEGIRGAQQQTTNDDLG